MMTTIKYDEQQDWTKIIVTIVLTALVFIVIIGYTSLIHESRRQGQLTEAQRILNGAEIDIELKKNVRVWLFATDEGRMIYYDGKMFKATELE